MTDRRATAAVSTTQAVARPVRATFVARTSRQLSPRQLATFGTRQTETDVPEKDRQAHGGYAAGAETCVKHGGEVSSVGLRRLPKSGVVPTESCAGFTFSLATNFHACGFTATA